MCSCFSRPPGGSTFSDSNKSHGADPSAKKILLLPFYLMLQEYNMYLLIITIVIGVIILN